MSDKITVALQTCDADLFNSIKSKYIDTNVELLSVEQEHICLDIWKDFGAVIFVESNQDCFNKQINLWVGHPHLRYIKRNSDKASAVCSEIDVLLSNIELEKKFLIEYPDINELLKYPICKSHIEQTYLLCDNGSHRIRKRECGSSIAYFETLKLRINNSKCIEHEGLISQAEFNDLMQHKNPEKITIIKDRYTLLYDGQYFELDIYPFWQDKAVIELELRDENQKYTLPPEIKIIRDVSDDYTYKNNYLAGLKL